MTMCVLFVYLSVVLGLTEWSVELLSNYTSLDKVKFMLLRYSEVTMPRRKRWRKHSKLAPPHIHMQETQET